MSLDRVERAAAVASLRHMISKGYFSICTIDKILKASGAIPDRRAYNILNMLHCVDFSDMEPDVRDELPELLRLALGGGPVLDVNIPQPERTIRRGLLAPFFRSAS